MNQGARCIMLQGHDVTRKALLSRCTSSTRHQLHNMHEVDDRRKHLHLSNRKRWQAQCCRVPIVKPIGNRVGRELILLKGVPALLTERHSNSEGVVCRDRDSVAMKVVQGS